MHEPAVREGIGTLVLGEGEVRLCCTSRERVTAERNAAAAKPGRVTRHKSARLYVQRLQ